MCLSAPAPRAPPLAPTPLTSSAWAWARLPRTRSASAAWDTDTSHRCGAWSAETILATGDLDNNGQHEIPIEFLMDRIKKQYLIDTGLFLVPSLSWKLIIGRPQTECRPECTKRRTEHHWSIALTLDWKIPLFIPRRRGKTKTKELQKCSYPQKWTNSWTPASLESHLRWQ